MQIPRIPDLVPTTAVDLLSLLCSQSGSLHQALLRLTNAQAVMKPPGPDGWRGRAESVQALGVNQMDSLVGQVCVMVESAQQLTDAAIWGVRDVG